MPLELGVWRIDRDLQQVEFSSLNLESRLEGILDKDITIASPNWMVIGRQVRTTFEKIVDLLAIDQTGNLVVIELKRDKTYRDIVAQVLDYGSWVRTLHSEDIAKIFSDYRSRYRQKEEDLSLDQAFCRRFKLKEMPDELNQSHELVIVCSTLDPSTERIVTYLTEHHRVGINAIFFRVFRDGDREYLSRAWLVQPSAQDTLASDDDSKGQWNGEYYVSFGHNNDHRDWGEAIKYGFVSGGGGTWYTDTLKMLEPGSRIWVNVPGWGYVGVGRVTETAVPVDEFMVADKSGQKVPLESLPLKARNMGKAADNKEEAEYLVRVQWIKTVPLEQAIKEKGFFGNQNTVARPTTPKWNHTVERLKKRFGIS